MLPISTLPGPIDEENTYPPLPKYYFLIKTGLENGPKNDPKNSPKNGPKNSPIVQDSIGPVHILPYASYSTCYSSCWDLLEIAVGFCSVHEHV